jgi:serine/threonine protein kinase/tetratricopeptide (TPR) repeat protein
LNASAGLGSRSSSTDAVLAEIVEEVTNKLRAGEPADIEAYVGAHPELAERLGRLLPALAVLADLGRSAASGEPVLVSSAQAPTGEMAELGDFRIVGEIGRGGMGVVYEAVQLSLGRRVALKVLPFAAALDPRQLQRFKTEAQAAALLHHTNIVPVHAVGCERGVHYYAMQRIDGQNLAAVIRELRRQAGHAADDEPSPPHAPARPSAETLALAGLSTERSCSSPAYFRAVAQLGVQAAEALEHAHDEGVVHRDIKPANLLVDAKGKLWITDFGVAHCRASAELTMTGDIVGTLRYMSPEQALGKRLLVDHRTDIYSLGVTLYELLTLEPAFAGNDRAEVLRQIASEEPKTPRRINKAIPAELETIGLKALGKSPEERYATAQELADDLRRFLEDKPIRARRPTLVRRLVKWGRRHRPLVAAGGALLLAMVLLGGGNLWWLGRQRAETERAVAGYLQRAELLQEQDRWDEAAQVLARAEERLGSGPAGLLEEVLRLRDEADWVAELEEARLCAADTGPDDKSQFNFAGADRAYGEAFVRRGLDVGALDPEEAAARIRATRIRSRLVEALDSWAEIKDQLRVASGEGLRAVAGLADDNPWRQRLRQLITRTDRAALEQLAAEDAAVAQPPAIVVLLSRALKATGGQAGAERLLRRALQLHPADFWTNVELATRLALAIEPSAPTKSAIDRRTASGRVEEGLGFYRAALAIRPQSPVVHNNLGLALRTQGKPAEAEAACRKAIALRPDLPEARCNLGHALVAQGKPAEAEAAFRKAIELRPGFPEAHNNLGTALAHQGKLAEAAAAFREAARLKPDYPKAHCNLGSALRGQGKAAEAEAAFRRAIAVRRDYPLAHYNLGIALADQGKLAEAEAAFRKATELKPDFAEAFDNLGNVLADQGKLAEAEVACRKAIELKPAELAKAYNNLGTILQDQGKLAQAVEACRQAIALEPRYAPAYYNLGNALRGQGKLAEAEAAYRKAIALQHDDPEAHCNLGIALRDQRRFVEALAAFKRGQALGSQDPRSPHPSAQWVQQCERFVQLDGKLPAILSGKEQPADAAERIALAELCQLPCKKRYATAARFYREAFAAEAKRADDRPSDARYDAACAAALAGCGQGVDADTLDTTARARLRQQALDWLRADRAAWQVLEGDRSKAAPAVREKMQHWLQDTDFAGVRGPQALAKLPEAERSAWGKLWAEVEELFAQAGGKTSAPEM